MLEISLFDVLIKVFLEFIITSTLMFFFLLAFRSLKKKKKYGSLFLFTFICPCCIMADSSGYNLFYFELRMQYMWPIAGGYFVNVDFVVLGHSSNKRKGILTPFWWNKYCNKFSTSLCRLSAESVTCDVLCF